MLAEKMNSFLINMMIKFLIYISKYVEKKKKKKSLYLY